MLADDGNLYSLCPVIPNKVILSADAYESLQEYCRESREQQELNLQLFEAFQEAKVFKEGRYHFDFTKKPLTAFDPQMVGPL